MAPSTSARKQQKKTLTLCLVVREGRVLLGMKKRGFGAGRWNGFGGKLEPGESTEQGARRELREESGIEAQAMAPCASLTFRYRHTNETLVVEVFRVDRFDGEPVETEEMRPCWFAFHEFPYAQAWPDDRYWMPHVLAGRAVKGEFDFTDYDTIESYGLDVATAPALAVA